MTFSQKLSGCAEANKSLVCVGLDTDPGKLPAQFPRTAEGVVAFNREIIHATSDIVCAYKPNAAFYEALGSEGIDALVKTCEAIPVAIPVILDVKRGDIGTTAERYAASAYDIVGADAVTVNPYMGFDAVKPFLRDEKGVFVLCVTSNPTADDFQMLSSEGMPLYQHIATRAVRWSEDGMSGSLWVRHGPRLWRPSGNSSVTCRYSSPVSVRRAVISNPLSGNVTHGRGRLLSTVHVVFFMRRAGRILPRQHGRHANVCAVI